jgi:hypothetical protein
VIIDCSRYEKSDDRTPILARLPVRGRVLSSPFNLRAYVTRAKKAGVYKGRPAKIKADDIAALKARGLGVSEIARRLKIGRARLYRVAG